MISEAHVEDKNAVVLIGSDGLAAFGRLPEDARQDLSPSQVEELERQVQEAGESFAQKRSAATEFLSGLGLEGVEWPLSEEVMSAIRSGSVPPGLLVTRVPLNGNVEGVTRN